MAVVTVIHDDGRVTRMTDTRFAAVQSDGWRLYDPASVSPSTSASVRHILAAVGNDPVKAAAALDLERSDRNRPTLIKKLAAIADAGASTSEEE